MASVDASSSLEQLDISLAAPMSRFKVIQHTGTYQH
jgi:hypothetical protein